MNKSMNETQTGMVPVLAIFLSSESCIKSFETTEDEILFNKK